MRLMLKFIPKIRPWFEFEFAIFHFQLFVFEVKTSEKFDSFKIFRKPWKRGYNRWNEFELRGKFRFSLKQKLKMDIQKNIFGLILLLEINLTQKNCVGSIFWKRRRERNTWSWHRVFTPPKKIDLNKRNKLISIFEGSQMIWIESKFIRKFASTYCRIRTLCSKLGELSIIRKRKKSKLERERTHKRFWKERIRCFSLLMYPWFCCFG